MGILQLGKTLLWGNCHLEEIIRQQFPERAVIWQRKSVEQRVPVLKLFFRLGEVHRLVRTISIAEMPFSSCDAVNLTDAAALRNWHTSLLFNWFRRGLFPFVSFSSGSETCRLINLAQNAGRPYWIYFPLSLCAVVTWIAAVPQIHMKSTCAFRAPVPNFYRPRIVDVPIVLPLRWRRWQRLITQILPSLSMKFFLSSCSISGSRIALTCAELINLFGGETRIFVF